MKSWLFRSGGPKYWSFSFSVTPSNKYSGLIALRIDRFDLLAVQVMYGCESWYPEKLPLHSAVHAPCQSRDWAGPAIRNMLLSSPHLLEMSSHHLLSSAPRRGYSQLLTFLTLAGPGSHVFFACRSFLGSFSWQEMKSSVLHLMEASQHFTPFLGVPWCVGAAEAPDPRDWTPTALLFRRPALPVPAMGQRL